MSSQLSQIKWGRMTIRIISVYIFSFLTMMAVIMGYATYLGFQARGMPDPNQIARFANQFAPLIGSFGLIPFTFLIAFRMSRNDEALSQIQGITLGVGVCVLNLAASRSWGLQTLIVTMLTLGAGWLGSKLGNRK